MAQTGQLDSGDSVLLAITIKTPIPSETRYITGDDGKTLRWLLDNIHGFSHDGKFNCLISGGYYRFLVLLDGVEIGYSVQDCTLQNMGIGKSNTCSIIKITTANKFSPRVMYQIELERLTGMSLLLHPMLKRPEDNLDTKSTSVCAPVLKSTDNTVPSIQKSPEPPVNKPSEQTSDVSKHSEIYQQNHLKTPNFDPSTEDYLSKPPKYTQLLVTVNHAGYPGDISTFEANSGETLNDLLYRVPRLDYAGDFKYKSSPGIFPFMLSIDNAYFNPRAQNDKLCNFGIGVVPGRSVRISTGSHYAHITVCTIEFQIVPPKINAISDDKPLISENSCEPVAKPTVTKNKLWFEVNGPTGVKFFKFAGNDSDSLSDILDLIAKRVSMRVGDETIVMSKGLGLRRCQFSFSLKDLGIGNGKGDCQFFISNFASVTGVLLPAQYVVSYKNIKDDDDQNESASEDKPASDNYLTVKQSDVIMPDLVRSDLPARETPANISGNTVEAMSGKLEMLLSPLSETLKNINQRICNLESHGLSSRNYINSMGSAIIKIDSSIASNHDMFQVLLEHNAEIYIILKSLKEQCSSVMSKLDKLKTSQSDALASEFDKIRKDIATMKVQTGVQQTECTICESRPRDTVLSKCGHTFCKLCVDEFPRAVCPICQSPDLRSHPFYLQ